MTKTTKSAKDVNTKAKDTAALRELKKTATAINKALEDASKLTAQADDKRLVAAVKLAEAKKECSARKINFQEWVKENVSQSWNTVRLLIPVGDAEIAKTGDGKAKLETMRERNKQANQKHRASKATPTNATPANSTPANSTPANSTPANSTPKPQPESVVTAIKRLSVGEQQALLRSQADALGHVLRSKEEAENEKRSAKVSPAERAKAAFLTLDAKSQKTFLDWATKRAKQSAKEAKADQEVNDLILPALDRRTKAQEAVKH